MLCAADTQRSPTLYFIKGSTNPADTNAWVTVTNLTLTEPASSPASFEWPAIARKGASGRLSSTSGGRPYNFADQNAALATMRRKFELLGDSL